MKIKILLMVVVMVGLGFVAHQVYRVSFDAGVAEIESALRLAQASAQNHIKQVDKAHQKSIRALSSRAKATNKEVIKYVKGTDNRQYLDDAGLQILHCVAKGYSPKSVRAMSRPAER